MCNLYSIESGDKINGFNPLYIGSMCNKGKVNVANLSLVSIPFISGQCVISYDPKVIDRISFNPLYIGSMCNTY